MTPKVSVVMSVYNGSNFLYDAVESILSQTYENFEFVIIDDRSTDDTWKILNDFACRDIRIQLSRNETNLGLTRSLNRGLLLSRGLYVARQDHDDVSLPLRLEKQVRFLDANPSIDMVSCNFDVIDENGDFIRRKTLSCEPILIEWNLIFYNYIEGHSQVMFRRERVMSLGGYEESLKYAQDYDLWLRLSRSGKIAILPEVLLKYRTHDQRLTHTAADKQFSSLLMTSSKWITELTDRQVTKEDVRSLWSFWCFVHRLNLSHTQLLTASKIHNLLRSIYRAFLARNAEKCLTIADNECRYVTHAIAKQYFRWFIFAATRSHDFKGSMIMLAGIIYWLRFDSVGLASKQLIRLATKELHLSLEKHFPRFSRRLFFHDRRS